MKNSRSEPFFNNSLDRVVKMLYRMTVLKKSTLVGPTMDISIKKLVYYINMYAAPMDVGEIYNDLVDLDFTLKEVMSFDPDTHKVSLIEENAPEMSWTMAHVEPQNKKSVDASSPGKKVNVYGKLSYTEKTATGVQKGTSRVLSYTGNLIGWIFDHQNIIIAQKNRAIEPIQEESSVAVVEDGDGDIHLVKSCDMVILDDEQ